MTPIYLRFADAAEALAIFNAIVGGDEAASLTDVPPVVFISGVPIYIDVIFGTGIVMRATGETTTDDEGNSVEVLALVAGFHVNLLLPDDVTLPDALVAHQIQPANPACAWSTARATPSVATRSPPTRSTSASASARPWTPAAGSRP